MKLLEDHNEFLTEEIIQIKNIINTIEVNTETHRNLKTLIHVSSIPVIKDWSIEVKVKILKYFGKRYEMIDSDIMRNITLKYETLKNS